MHSMVVLSISVPFTVYSTGPYPRHCEVISFKEIFRVVRNGPRISFWIKIIQLSMGLTLRQQKTLLLLHSDKV